MNNFLQKRKFKKLFFKKNIIVRDKIILDNIAKAKEFIDQKRNTEAMLLLGNIYIAHFENIHSKLKQTLKTTHHCIQQFQI